MFCHNCGNEVPERAKFCPKCGVEVIVKKVEKSEDKKVGTRDFKKVSKATSSDNLVRTTSRFKGMQRNKILVALLAGVIIMVGVLIFGGGSSSSDGYSNNDYYDRDYQNNRDDDNDYDYNYGSLDNKSEMHCPSCSGSGTCRKCSGSGKDTMYVAGGTTTTSSCDYCYGSGRCKSCGGDGKQ